MAIIGILLAMMFTISMLLVDIIYHITGIEKINQNKDRM